MKSGHLTDCGIPSIGKIPWGSHFCQFYSKKKDLVDALLPYFQAGLRNNERCLWITSDPFRAAEAKTELQRVLPDLEERLRNQQIVIRDFEEWYPSTAPVDGSAGTDQWLREEKLSLDAGYAGLRVTGNASFLKQEDWQPFLHYERVVNRLFRSRKIIALCSYNIKNCSANHIFEVVRSHHFTVDRIGDSWEVIEKEERPFRE
jgi:hypothetical protein